MVDNGCVARVSFILSWLPASHLNDRNRNAPVSSTLNLKIWSFFNTTGVSSRIEKSLDDQKLHQRWATYKTWTLRLVKISLRFWYDKTPFANPHLGWWWARYSWSTQINARPYIVFEARLAGFAHSSMDAALGPWRDAAQGQISSDIHRYPCFEISLGCWTWFCTLRLRIYLSTFQLST